MRPERAQRVPFVSPSYPSSDVVNNVGAWERGTPPGHPLSPLSRLRFRAKPGHPSLIRPYDTPRQRVLLRAIMGVRILPPFSPSGRCDGTASRYCAAAGVSQIKPRLHRRGNCISPLPASDLQSGKNEKFLIDSDSRKSRHAQLSHASALSSASISDKRDSSNTG
jgi:hypothetical protein